MGKAHYCYFDKSQMEQPERLLLVTKWVYPEAARQYNTNWKAIERNIRTVNGIVWEQGRPFLEELASRELLSNPTATG